MQGAASNLFRVRGPMRRRRVFPGSASPNPASVPGKLVLAGVSLNLEDVREDGLYVMNADGSGLRQITHSGSDGQPHWSPDGRSIAFIEENADFVERVVVVHADGSGRRTLGISSSLAAPDPWSPDGKRIASGGCGGLCVFDLASHRRTRIALGSDDARGFSGSPDGRKLAAVDRAYRLVAADATGGTLRSSPRRGSTRRGRRTAKNSALPRRPQTRACAGDRRRSARGRQERHRRADLVARRAPFALHRLRPPVGSGAERRDAHEHAGRQRRRDSPLVAERLADRLRPPPLPVRDRPGRLARPAERR